MEVEFGARSRRGPLRSVNEDHYLILRLGRHQETLMTSLPDGEKPPRFDEYAYGMVIADGLGWHGEVASRLAITTLAHLAVYFGKWNVRIDEAIAEEMMDRVEQFYRDVDATLVQADKYSPVRLQTTLTAVCTAGSDLFFAHVGHSRAYLFRDGELLQLTHDHTHDRCHTLTETIGKLGASPKIDVERLGLLDGDALLLCTNGLTDVVPDARIADALRLHATPQERCRALVNLVIAAEGTDDATVLVAQYRIPE